MTTLKLGKKDATEDKRDLRLANYTTGVLPTPPASFGHENLIYAWGMLGNDSYGDCVFAGAAHETMLWNAAAQAAPVDFDDKSVLSDYSALTGFDPRDPSTDGGTDMRQACGYRRSRGVVDAGGERHKIGAYAALEPGDLEQLKLATYLFGAVGVGVQFPSSAMDEFNQGRTWSYHRNAKVEGGHYIPVVAWHHDHPICVTWGRLQPMSKAFFEHFCDEAFVMFSPELLRDGKSPEGVDGNQLLGDLQRVTTA